MIFRYIVMACIVTLAGCSTSLPTFRYRLTVEVETPTGIRSGSSVIEVLTVDQRSIGMLHHRVLGNAVAIKLPDGRYLFALLRDNGPDRTIFKSAAPFWAFDNQLPADRSNYHRVHRALTQAKGKAELPPKHFPMFVIFENIRRPETVRAVPIIDFKSELGVKLHSVTVEITDDPVNDDIASILPWAGPQMRTQLDGASTTNSDALANKLGVLDFRAYDFWSLKKSQ